MIGSTGCSWNSNEVATPKLPPPPRSPQNRSWFCWLLAVRNLPSRGHQIDGAHVVAGQAEAPAETAEAAAQRESADAGVRHRAGRGRESVRQRLAIERA